MSKAQKRQGFDLDRVLAILSLVVLSPTLWLLPFPLIAAAAMPLRLAACLWSGEFLAETYAGTMGMLGGATVELLAAVWLIGFFAFFVGTVLLLVRGPGTVSTVVWACTLLYCVLMVGTRPWTLPFLGTLGLTLAWLRIPRGKGSSAPA
jgi:hypothetical protein